MKLIRKNNQGGFALLALLIFLVIVGLASAAVVTTTSLIERRLDEEQLLIVGAQYKQAIQTYVTSTPAGKLPYPTKLNDLLKDPRYPGVRRYIRQLYPDPLSGKLDWTLIKSPMQQDGIMGVHSSFEGKPIKQSNFTADVAMFSDAASYAAWEFAAGNGHGPLNGQPAILESSGAAPQ